MKSSSKIIIIIALQAFAGGCTYGPSESDMIPAIDKVVEDINCMQLHGQYRTGGEAYLAMRGPVDFLDTLTNLGVLERRNAEYSYFSGAKINYKPTETHAADFVYKKSSYYEKDLFYCPGTARVDEIMEYTLPSSGKESATTVVTFKWKAEDIPDIIKDAFTSAAFEKFKAKHKKTSLTEGIAEIALVQTNKGWKAVPGSLKVKVKE